ncbi:MAG: amidase [Actinomycetota bacterium]|nr:amidase [Actinomycetota bacterium]
MTEATNATDELGAFRVGPRLLAAGTPGGPLGGRRFAAKDLFDVAGERTGAGNPRVLAAASEADAHASAVRRLLDAGADLWGKTITDELAFSLSGTNVHYGTPQNPAAPGRVPGGSSSGSASAVAGGVVDLALGTDTGGSIRIPASYCGLFGLRTTWGAVPADGLVPLAPSFDTIGVFARDAALLGAAIDALCDPPAGVADTGDATATTLLIATDAMGLADREAGEALAEAAHRAGGALGLSVGTVELFDGVGADEAFAAFRAIQTAEAWLAHGEVVGSRRLGLGPGVAARFDAGAAVTAAEVAAAEPVRMAVLRRLRRLCAGGTVIALPSASGAAPSPEMTGPPKDDLRGRTLRLTSPAGLAGQPALSIPAAHVEGGLPVGLCLIGASDTDRMLCALARRWQDALGD